ncbi:hypothetical protein [Streptomyces sp. NPDC054863]
MEGNPCDRVLKRSQPKIPNLLPFIGTHTAYEVFHGPILTTGPPFGNAIKTARKRRKAPHQFPGAGLSRYQ